MFDESVWLVGTSGTFRFAISGSDHQGLVYGAEIKLTGLQRGDGVRPSLSPPAHPHKTCLPRGSDQLAF